MSQPPNSQPSPSPQPQEQDTRTPQVTSFTGVLKTQSVKVLRGTINVLEKLVAKLEAEPTAPTTPIWDKLQRGWSKFLARIRNFLPENASISDPALTGIIAGIVVVLVGTTALFLSPKAPQKVAEVPPVPVQQPTPVEPLIEEPSPITAPLLTAPEPPQPIAEIPSPIPSESESSEPVPSEPMIESTPLPVIQPTPEQNLIAAIEKQVAQISDRYGDGTIQSLRVNFPASSLTVTLTADWYNLNPAQQDKLAAQMFQRAKELDFIYLEVVDPQGNLLARSPAIGENMVILKRQA